MPFAIKKELRNLLLLATTLLSQYERGKSFSRSSVSTRLTKTITTTTNNGMTISPSDSSTTYQPLFPTENDDRDTIKVETTNIELSSGTTAQIMTARPTPPPPRRKDAPPHPPLIFIHGSFHAAWCWAEHYLIYFAERGYYATALSLRGTGGTPVPPGVRKVTMAEHVEDLAAFVEYIRGVGAAAGGDEAVPPPCVIGHSFGGPIIMKYLESLDDRRPPSSDNKFVTGVGMLCSVPPSGNGKMTMRYLRRSLVDSWKITKGLAMKKCVTDGDLCRTLFFGDDKEESGVTDDDIVTIRSYFGRDSVATIDVSDFLKCLPSKSSVDGRAPFLSRLEKPALVVGARGDFIVDWEGVEETAYYFGVEPVFLDSSHDVMLGAQWRYGADEILKWLQND